ncbi:methyltransferase family protein [Herbihabitans rhizosphaerae]|uniref:Methyltransferase family protein n=1 Tax=Herbihabitans rhizosphaerae TaxID=1872711 RepID=A0A4Q7KFQ8_9PSEU|nr:class I SAM-dependent methyltransferase [Herbihabitans rhizosphaerae]RZS34063.1 methyltransferase family protein [Herbihabitans rhizosphaerae]
MAIFDQIGKAYDESYGDRPAQVDEVAWLIEQLPPGARVLDVGCGSGLPTAKQLLDGGAEVVGVDESRVMLDLAEQQAPGGQYLQKDFRELDGLGEFDAAVAFFSLLMLGRDEIPQVLSTIASMLRGPKLLLLSMVPADFDLFPIEFLGQEVKVSAYPAEVLGETVTAAGFEVLRLVQVQAKVGTERTEEENFVRARAV